jgi:hypothetical protein
MQCKWVNCLINSEAGTQVLFRCLVPRLERCDGQADHTPMYNL